MKGIAPLMIGIVILAVVGILAVSTGSFYTGEIVTVGGKTCELMEGAGVVPDMGFYECGKIGRYENNLALQKGGSWIDCDKYTDRCYVKITSPGQEHWLLFFKVKIRMVWEKWNVGGSMVDNGVIQDVQDTGTGTTLFDNSLQSRQTFYIHFQKNICILGDEKNECYANVDDSMVSKLPKVNIQADLYGLGRYGPQSGWIDINKQGCTMPLLSLDSAKPCIEGSKCVMSWDGKTALQPTEKKSYFDGWKLAPLTYKFIDYNNEKVYCANGVLYSLDYLRTYDNACYFMPGGVKETKGVCCSGDSFGTNMNCINFQWVITQEKECTSIMQCEGQGQWVIDITDSTRKTSVKATGCTDGKCMYERKQTGCGICPSDKVCQTDYQTGIGSCVSSGPTPFEPQPVPGGEARPAFDFMGILGKFVGALIIALVLLGIFFVVTVLVPFLAPLRSMVFKNYKYLMIVVLILALMIFVVAGGLSSLTAQMVIGA